jgi:hypothetical protein
MASEMSDKTSAKTFFCTLKMLNSVQKEGEKPSYKGQAISSIQIVARIKTIQESSLRYDLILEDHSGNFNVCYYKKLTSSKDSMKTTVFRENNYIQVVGNFRKMQETSSFIIGSVLPLYSRAEINEFLSVVLTSYLKTFPKPKKKTEEVYKSFMKFPSRIKGYTAGEIMNMLNFEISVGELESALNELMTDNRIKNGVDWNHYRV